MDDDDKGLMNNEPRDGVGRRRGVAQVANEGGRRSNLFRPDDEGAICDGGHGQSLRRVE
jgi:hypothetical protein